MAVPNVAGTGMFIGPFNYLHINDTSSHGVGGASSTADVWFGNTSTLPVGGVIEYISIITPNPSSTAALTLTVDGNTSSQPVITGFNTGTYTLGIGFTNSFVISNSSASGHAIVSFLMAPQ